MLTLGVCFPQPYRSGILFASHEVMHRLRSDYPLHFNIVNILMNFALRYGENQTHAGVNPGLIRSQTLTTRSTVYIRLVPNAPITWANHVYTIGTKCSHHT